MGEILNETLVEMQKPTIKEIEDSPDISRSASIIKDSFQTVALEFGVTNSNCPSHPSTITVEQVKKIKKKGLRFFGLFLGGEQIGFIAIETADAELYHFEKLAVLPEYRHRGYGAMLVKFALDYVQSNNGMKVEIGIINEHRVLKDWYRALGFKETGARKFGHLPFTVGFMEKDLLNVNLSSLEGVKKVNSKVNVGILGATGMVGQYYVRLLSNHPWFEIAYLAASPASSGKKYCEAVAGRWHMPIEIPEAVCNLEVADAGNVSNAIGKCALVFSAVEMDKQAILAIEEEYARQGLVVVSNNSAHRHTENVPIMIPEINPQHLDIIPYQQKRHGWNKGFIIVKPNCSIQSYMMPVSALMKAGYVVKKMVVATLQALSGAGYPGLSALDLVDNILPYAAGEEEKSEVEPPKIWGDIKDGKLESNNTIKISAHCNRVPVVDGHLACVSLQFGSRKPEPAEIIRIWQEFRSVPQELGLPSAPAHPVIYRPEIDRPQPRKDRDAENGMAVTVGRLRPCNVLDYRFVGLHHNMIRGAAGGSILTAELLKARGLI